MLDNIHLSYPAWLLLSPVCIAALYFLGTRRRISIDPVTGWISTALQASYLHPGLSRLLDAQAAAGDKHRRRSLVGYLNLFIILFFLSLALSQPYRVGQRLPDPPQHRDVVFLLDTSVSMVIRDYIVDEQRIDRLTMLKTVLSHFIDALDGNRIQLITYSEKIYTYVPLTRDYDLLKYQLNRLQSASLTGRLSDLGRAILYAANEFDPATQADGKPVFVMLTDAHRPVRDIDPRAAAEYMANRGYRMHTIAIGGASYAAEDKQRSTLIYHPVNFQLLESIAGLANGRFFWARDMASLEKALQAIKTAEKIRQDVQPRYLHQSLYFWPLLVAVCWLGLLYMARILIIRVRT